MDMSIFANALANAGFTVEDDTRRFKSYDDFILPFTTMENPYAQLLDDANVVYEKAHSTTKAEIKRLCKILPETNIDEDYDVLHWLATHSNKVKIFKRSEFCENDEMFKDSICYNVFACFAEYNKYERNIRFHISDAKSLHRMLNVPGFSVWQIETNTIETLNVIASVCEFIPLLVDDSNGVYYNLSSTPENEWLSSYGENILKSQSTLDLLESSNFFGFGAKILPGAWYFFTCKNLRFTLIRDTSMNPS